MSAMAIIEAARLLLAAPVDDDTIVVEQEEGVSEMPLTWGELVGPLRVAIVNFEVPEPIFDDEGRFHGHEPRGCRDHRTVGPHRAWCHDCTEWCYPSAPCIRCSFPAE